MLHGSLNLFTCYILHGYYLNHISTLYLLHVFQNFRVTNPDSIPGINFLNVLLRAFMSYVLLVVYSNIETQGDSENVA